MSTQLEQSYREVKKTLDNISPDTEERLLFIANYLFDMYSDLRKKDTLHKSIEVPPLRILENYSELTEAYAFHRETYVYIVLNAAHDILLASEQMRLKGKEIGSQSNPTL